MKASIRLVRVGDAGRLSGLHLTNRQYLLAGGPGRDDEWMSVNGQRRRIGSMLSEHDAGRCVPFVIEVDRLVVGTITVNDVVRGALQSAAVGYWVASDFAGCGVATEALRRVVRHSFDELRLHRLQAETTLTNAPSAAVLAKNGFRQFGVAEDYLHVGGRWQTCRMFQIINPDWTP